MGRNDPTWSDEQIAELVRLVHEEAWAIRQAATKLGIPYETARQYIADWNRANPDPLDPDNPIGEMASELNAIANHELTALKRQVRNPNNKQRIDLDRAAKLAKLLLDLDKLRKSNRKVEPEEKPESPLAGLVKPSDVPVKLLMNNGKPATQSGSVADASDRA